MDNSLSPILGKGFLTNKTFVDNPMTFDNPSHKQLVFHCDHLIAYTILRCVILTYLVSPTESVSKALTDAYIEPTS